MSFSLNTEQAWTHQISNVRKAQLLTSIPNKLTKEDKTEVFSLMPKWGNAGKRQKLNYHNHMTIHQQQSHLPWFQGLVFLSSLLKGKGKEKKKKTSFKFSYLGKIYEHFFKITGQTIF